MMSRFVPVAFVVFGFACAAQPAHAQQWGYGCAPQPMGQVTYGWQGPMTYQPTPYQAAPQTAPSNGQMAQSNGQTYQSFSAPPTPAYGAAPIYTAPSYPAYGGYYGGYYSSPYYYGGSYGYSPGWRSLDTANHHGTSY
jgi:hypothetical protein